MLAEFRKDWEVALRAYEAGYSELLRLPVGSVLPLQRFFELLACAEVFHFKVQAYMLHEFVSKSGYGARGCPMTSTLYDL